MSSEYQVPGMRINCQLFNATCFPGVGIVAANEVFHQQHIPIGVLDSLQQGGHGIDFFDLFIDKPLQEIVAGEIILFDGDAHQIVDLIGDGHLLIESELHSVGSARKLITNSWGARNDGLGAGL